MKDLFDEGGAERMSRILMVALGAGILVLAFLSLWQRNQMIHIGYEIERLQQEKEEMRLIRKDLLAEVETLSAVERIEQIATEQLGMKPADSRQRIYIHPQRIQPAGLETSPADRG
ncbi:MAG: cell division protein FtsL [Nitrospiria bacterium]